MNYIHDSFKMFGLIAKKSVVKFMFIIVKVNLGLFAGIIYLDTLSYDDSYLY